eukprot:1141294-Pelagomonas_calceolata.AAC.1
MKVCEAWAAQRFQTHHAHRHGSVTSLYFSLKDQSSLPQSQTSVFHQVHNARAGAAAAAGAPAPSAVPPAVPPAVLLLTAEPSLSLAPPPAGLLCQHLLQLCSLLVCPVLIHHPLPEYLLPEHPFMV